ncbi:UDP-Glycosyltransferase/glycogen phosphorylase [Daedaleopsis nitida]|nr:UDP-Glycosyltransferase/glycogen phosphorylase [Daedaleopsis nitida]
MSDTGIHIVCHPTQAWGHVRPLIHLAARLVKLRRLNLTFLTTNGYIERVKTELARSFEDGDDDEYAKRIRVIAAGDVQFISSEEANQAFEVVWKGLIEEREPVCTHTGIRYPSLPKPKAIIIDIFAIDPLDSIKALSGDSVKVYSWHPGLTFAMFHLFGPESLGGQGNIRIKAEATARLTGRSYAEVANEMSWHPKGNVVRIPGMPPMFDHEYYPQDFPFPEDIGTKLIPRIFETMEKADGVFLFTPESYEPEAVAAVRRWYAETSRPVYVCGPLLPSASKMSAHEKEKKLSTESSEIQLFLDEALKTSGEKSVVYISFGSILWPVKTPEKLWAFLDVLMELNLPFILSYASPLASVPDHIRDKVKVYGKGVLSPWTPQQLILDHPATGWFVAHGGHNGVTEAISAGVPQILWPFGGDQSLNAVHIADNLQIGYELFEVRTGSGLRPIYRTGYTPVGTIDAVKEEARTVLAKAFGEDGAQKRARLVEVQKGVVREWEDGGAAKRDVVAFLDSLDRL